MNTTIQTAHSLYVVYRQLPKIVQKEFERILTTKNKQEDWTDKEWMKLSEETLEDIWGTPENDIWDKFYAEQINKENV